MATERQIEIAREEIFADLEQRLRFFQDKQPTAQWCSNMRAVIDYGRPYVGINRPKGYRKRKAKQCFWNAARLAINDCGTYVEGYASLPIGGPALHHAWVTLDGVHAVDVTWDAPADCHYVGIAFPKKIVADTA